MRPRNAWVALALLAGTACSKPAEVTANEEAADVERNRTTQNAIDDVDAALAAGRPADALPIINEANAGDLETTSNLE